MSKVEEKEVEIKELVLKLGKLEAKLSVKEARKLLDALTEIFGKDKEIVREVNHCRDHWYPYYWPKVTWVSDTGTVPSKWVINSNATFNTGNDRSTGFLTIT